MHVLVSCLHAHHGYIVLKFLINYNYFMYFSHTCYNFLIILRNTPLTPAKTNLLTKWDLVFLAFTFIMQRAKMSLCCESVCFAQSDGTIQVYINQFKKG